LAEASSSLTLKRSSEEGTYCSPLGAREATRPVYFKRSFVLSSSSGNDAKHPSSARES
jgi:hypothetical protein